MLSSNIKNLPTRTYGARQFFAGFDTARRNSADPVQQQVKKRAALCWRAQALLENAVGPRLTHSKLTSLLLLTSNYKIVFNLGYKKMVTLLGEQSLWGRLTSARFNGKCLSALTSVVNRSGCGMYYYYLEWIQDYIGNQCSYRETFFSSLVDLPTHHPWR